MIAWFAKNSVAANLLMVGIIIGGVMSLRDGLRLEIFPSSEPDTVSVSVPLRGATPEDVELGVAVRIEEAIQDLVGIDRVTSRSVEGSTRVQILTRSTLFQPKLKSPLSASAYARGRLSVSLSPATTAKMKYVHLPSEFATTCCESMASRRLNLTRYADTK